MDVLELTRALVNIESITNHEEPVGLYLLDFLSQMVARTSGRVERCDVEPGRFNVFARWGDPVVTLSTHMDTVPPFFPAREDADCIWGRGACDAKGIVAAMIGAAEGLLAAGIRNFQKSGVIIPVAPHSRLMMDHSHGERSSKQGFTSS